MPVSSSISSLISCILGNKLNKLDKIIDISILAKCDPRQKCTPAPKLKFLFASSLFNSNLSGSLNTAGSLFADARNR